MTTGFLYDPRFLEHETGPGHPECPERLTAVMELLKKQDWYSKLKQFSGSAADLKWVEKAHSLDYVSRVKKACETGEPYVDSPDVPVCKESYDTALLAAGSALALGDAVMSGEVARAFGLIRPPGHHAEYDYAMGFCFFNNVAILARYLQEKYGIHKVAIIDWDVHHGNGTQHFFESDPSVYYMSLHQFPHYPGTGLRQERGQGEALGTQLNIPMRMGSHDWDYQEAFRRILLPALKHFHAEVIIISAGFDAHEDDPLGHILLTEDCFAWMTEQLCRVADHDCKGRVISLLEGGYNLDSLSRCVTAHVKALLGHRKKEEADVSDS